MPLSFLLGRPAESKTIHADLLTEKKKKRRSVREQIDSFFSILKANTLPQSERKLKATPPTCISNKKVVLSSSLLVGSRKEAWGNPPQYLKAPAVAPKKKSRASARKAKSGLSPRRHCFFVSFHFLLLSETHHHSTCHNDPKGVDAVELEVKDLGLGEQDNIYEQNIIGMSCHFSQNP